ncbi:MAG: hypothetical protein JWO97_1616 [Acidobacteria bacterium]|nr:hypothetical protein [Acidobacteriota bacterium]
MVSPWRCASSYMRDVSALFLTFSGTPSSLVNASRRPASPGLLNDDAMCPPGNRSASRYSSRRRPNPNIVHWIECVKTEDDRDAERPVPLESFLPLVHAAAYLGVKRATLYAWSAYLESVEKRGSRREVVRPGDVPRCRRLHEGPSCGRPAQSAAAGRAPAP